MLQGTVSIDEGFRRIAFSGGWPIRTTAGYLFATPAHGHDGLAVAGDHNGWSPASMQEQNGVLYAHVAAPHDSFRGYKFVSSDGTYFADPQARQYNYDHYGQISLIGVSGQRFERWPQVGGKGIAPRMLRVHVPAETPTHFLYVQDGQNLFDPNAMWGGWRLQDQLGPHTLAVGVDNTPNRIHELSPVKDFFNGVQVGGRGDDYADFMRHTVEPFIEAHYGEPEIRGVMGSSLGGLMAMHQARRNPDRYDFVASLSGTLGFGKMGQDEGVTLIDHYRDLGTPSSVVYLDSGGGPGKDNYDPTREMVDVLESRGFEHGKDLYHWYEPGAEHSERAWRARVFRPVGLFEAL